MFPFYYAVRSELGAEIVKDIVKAIDGQYNAISCYAKLAQLAFTEEERRRILEIQQDEVRHYQVFSHIYTTLTGKYPTPQLTESCSDSYSEGLEMAFKDEQNTVDFYLNISENTSEPYIKEQFRRAAMDEQNHAVWFLYFVIKNK